MLGGGRNQSLCPFISISMSVVRLSNYILGGISCGSYFERKKGIVNNAVIKPESRNQTSIPRFGMMGKELRMSWKCFQ
jgi:hypothetical protein